MSSNTLIPPKSIHTVEDVGAVLLSAQSDVHTLRLFLNQLQNNKQNININNTIDNDIITRLSNLLDTTESKLLSNAILLNESVHNNQLNKIDQYTHEQINAVIPYNSTIDISATQSAHKLTQRTNKYGGKLYKKSNTLIESIIAAPDQQQQHILSTVGNKLQHTAAQRHGSSLIRNAQQQLLTNSRQYNKSIQSRSTNKLKTQLKSNTLSFDNIRQFNGSRHSRYDPYESKIADSEPSKPLLLLAASNSRPNTAVHEFTNSTVQQSLPATHNTATHHQHILSAMYNTAITPSILMPDASSHLQATAARTYDTLIDTYSLHQLQIRNYRYVEQTNDYISFKRVHNTIWPYIAVVMNNLITICHKLKLQLAYVTGNSIVQLCNKHKHSLQQPYAILRDTELVYCIENIDFDVMTAQLKLMRFTLTPNQSIDSIQHNASISIQSIFKMYKQCIQYKLRMYNVSSVIRIQRWIRSITRRRQTHNAYIVYAEQQLIQWSDTQQNYIQQYNMYQQKFKTYVFIALSDQIALSDTVAVNTLMYLAELLHDNKSDILYITQHKLSADTTTHYTTMLQQYVDSAHSSTQNIVKHRIKYISIDERTNDILTMTNSSLPNIYSLLYTSSHTIQSIKQYVQQRNCVLINTAQHHILQQLAIYYNIPLQNDYAGDMNAACDSLLHPTSIMDQNVHSFVVSVLIQPNTAVTILSTYDQLTDNLIIVPCKYNESHKQQIKQSCTQLCHQLYSAGYTGYLSLHCYISNNTIYISHINTLYNPSMSLYHLTNNTNHCIYIPIIYHTNITLLQYHNFMAVLQINHIVYDYSNHTGCHVLLADSLTCGHIGLYVSEPTRLLCIQRAIEILNLLQPYLNSVQQNRLTQDTSIYSITTLIKSLKHQTKQHR